MFSSRSDVCSSFSFRPRRGDRLTANPQSGLSTVLDDVASPPTGETTTSVCFQRERKQTKQRKKGKETRESSRRNITTSREN